MVFGHSGPPLFARFALCGPLRPHYAARVEQRLGTQGVDRHTSIARCREPASDSRVPNPDWKAEAAACERTGGLIEEQKAGIGARHGWSQSRSPALAGIVGGFRSWTRLMIS